MDYPKLKKLIKIWAELMPSELEANEVEEDLWLTLKRFNFRRRVLAVPFLSPEDPHILAGYVQNLVEDYNLMCSQRVVQKGKEFQHETLIEPEKGTTDWLSGSHPLESLLKSYCSHLARQRTAREGIWGCWDGTEYEVYGVGANAKQQLSADFPPVLSFGEFALEEKPSTRVFGYRLGGTIFYAHTSKRYYGDRVLYRKAGEDVGWARSLSDFLDLRDDELRFQRLGNLESST